MTKQALSSRAAAGKPSMTLAISGKAKALKAEGKDVIGFAAGEPDCPTPEHICAAGKAAIDSGEHGYPPNPGTPALRKAVCERFREDIGVGYAPDQILVSAGAKYSLFLACQTLLGPGDEAILPAPYWVSYPEMIRLADAETCYLETSEENGFALTAADLEKSITDKTKLLILNSPSNPTGGVIPGSEIKAIGALLEKHGLWCLSDEIYDKLVYGDTAHTSIASFSDYCREHTIVINGVSKTYAMTGWRIGYAAGPIEVIKAMSNIQSQSTSAACFVAQAAAAEALSASQDCVTTMRTEFAARRELIVERLNSIEGITCPTPGGAFYVFPNVTGVFGKTVGGVTINSPMDFCNAALESALVAPVPGEAFGSSRHVRLSYATSREQIEEGCARLKRMLED